jgi:hypothetical protein
VAALIHTITQQAPLAHNCLNSCNYRQSSENQEDGRNAAHSISALLLENCVNFIYKSLCGAHGEKRRHKKAMRKANKERWMEKKVMNEL